jgi:hypothetical protein
VSFLIECTRPRHMPSSLATGTDINDHRKCMNWSLQAVLKIPYWIEFLVVIYHISWEQTSVKFLYSLEQTAMLLWFCFDYKQYIMLKKFSEERTVMPWLRKLVTGFSWRRTCLNIRVVLMDLQWTKWHCHRFFTEDRKENCICNWRPKLW